MNIYPVPVFVKAGSMTCDHHEIEELITSHGCQISYLPTELCLQTTSVQPSARRLWKKMNTEALSAHLRIHLPADRPLNDRAAVDDRVTEITRVLQEAIEEFTSWAKPSNRARDF